MSYTTTEKSKADMSEQKIVGMHIYQTFAMIAEQS